MSISPTQKQPHPPTNSINNRAASLHPHLLNAIGNTPMVQLALGTRHTLLAKLEYLNPGGSIKDRAALYMIGQAEKTGQLKPGGTIVEASSGNQGIALAMIGALKGYRVIITVPDRTSEEKIATLKAYGAEIHVCADTDKLDDPHSYHTRAEQLIQEIPGSFMPRQYFNTANTYAHFLTTGPEIWQQTHGMLTHIFIAMGSCGTISGVGKYLKEQNPAIRVIGIDAATSVLSSPCPRAYEAEGIGVDVISDTLDRSVIDEIVPIEDEPAFAMARKLAKKGFLVGISSGAVMHVALGYGKKLSEKDVAAVIFADSGRAYLSKLFKDA